MHEITTYLFYHTGYATIKTLIVLHELAKQMTTVAYLNTIQINTFKSISAQFKRLNLLVTECLCKARMLYVRRVDARIHHARFFLWRTSALNIPHETKPDSFRTFRLRVDGALFPIGHSDRRQLEFSVLLIFFRSMTGNYRSTGTVVYTCVWPDLVVQVLLDDSDPGQHVLAVLRLEQELAVGGGEPQHVLALCVAVRDVHQAGLDADWLWLVRRLAIGIRLGLLPVPVQAERVSTQDGVHLLPGTHAATTALQHTHK